ncbi:hypothetical protein [Planctomycetes bacterium K23_9]|uniref:hypothetical protein n=1 Tax=Stieleria marina TaxID=1930275 RepID=UPI00119F43A9
MGLLYSSLRLLLNAKQQGCVFDKVVTIGRQQLFLWPEEATQLAREFSDNESSHDLVEAQKLSTWAGFAEPFLERALKSESIDSIDFSDFEQATLVHDLNQPIPCEWENRFDAVIDGGTLEHIFNVPVALANYMKMVRVGGCVLICTNANNHCGHGFYQFSPELFCRVFSVQNGFELLDLVLVEHPFPGAELSPQQTCYSVVDPDAVNQRVGLVSNRPAMVMVLARRTSDQEIFRPSPQQSDYQTKWQAAADANVQATVADEVPKTLIGKTRRFVGNAKRRFAKALPITVRHWINGKQQRSDYSLSNRAFYQPWQPRPAASNRERKKK